ncbi:hypothetical protein ScPMuIL_008121 [Solemya velum]
MGVLDRYFGPVGNAQMERHLFRNMFQQPTETIDQFVTRLRQKAEFCTYTDVGERIKEQVIEKCTSHNLRRELLEKREDLTLEQLQTIARAMENSETNKIEGIPQHEVNRVQTRGISNFKRPSDASANYKRQSDSYFKRAPDRHNTELPSPVVLCGDFNAHNPLWGSERLDAKGRVIDSLLERTDLVLLNDGEGTHINNNGLLSHLDLSFVSYELATKCSWEVYQDSFGSDHFPIIITFFDSPTVDDTSKPPTFNFKKADWNLYSLLCLKNITNEIFNDDIDKFNLSLTSQIIDAAKGSIPKSKHKAKSGVPWWDNECEEAKKGRQQAYNKLKRSTNAENFIDYKKKCAIVKRVTKNARRSCWREYCSRVTKDTSIPKIWRTIKRMSHINQTIGFPTIKDQKGTIIVNPQQKADAFANHFANAQGLRICLGVPRTTPNEALQVEAGEMPLQLRRDQLSATYYVKSLALPTTHPLVYELSIAYEYYGQHNEGAKAKSRRWKIRGRNKSNVRMVSENGDELHTETDYAFSLIDDDKLVKIDPDLNDLNVIREENELFEKYTKCFEGIGKLKDFQLEIPIDETVTPVAQSLRFPFNLREKLEHKLDELEELDIIKSRRTNTLGVTSRRTSKIEREQAFQELKRRLENAETLGYFESTAVTKLITPVGLGAVLVQEIEGENHVICYISRSLTDTERRYSQTEKEALVIVWAYHKPLECIYSDKSTGRASARIHRWVLRLQSYKFKVVYIPGRDNIADSLSRLLEPKEGNPQTSTDDSDNYIHFVAINATPNALTTKEIERASSEDEEISEIREIIETNQWHKLSNEKLLPIKDELTCVGMLVLRGTRISIPISLRDRVLELAHEGHPGIVAMKRNLRTKVWWTGLDRRRKILSIMSLLSTRENTRKTRTDETDRNSDVTMATYLSRFDVPANRTTPHSVTGVSPAELMFRRKLRTKIPEICNTVEDLEVADRDHENKGKGKIYADTQTENKLTPTFYDRPFNVVKRHGNAVNLESGLPGQMYKRNITHVKCYRRREGEIPESMQNTCDVTPDIDKIASQSDGSETREINADEARLASRPVRDEAIPTPRPIRDMARPTPRPVRDEKLPIRFKDYEL